MKRHFVYKITCLCDEWKGKYYIGSHTGYVNDKYLGGGNKIKDYFKIYPKIENVTYIKEIIEFCKDEYDAKDREQEYLLKTKDDEMRLNVRNRTSYGKIKQKHSAESRARMSVAQKLRFATSDHPMKGHPRSEATKRKISITMKLRHANKAA